MNLVVPFTCPPLRVKLFDSNGGYNFNFRLVLISYVGYKNNIMQNVHLVGISTQVPGTPSVPTHSECKDQATGHYDRLTLEAPTFARVLHSDWFRHPLLITVFFNEARSASVHKPLE